MEGELLAVVGVPPWLPEEPIATFRRTYDPRPDVVQPHITLVFPVPASIGLDRFREHVRTVVSQTPSFDIRLHGLMKSWDHWLFLLVDEGRDMIVALHDELYTGILRAHLWTEQPFVPHVGLGLFVEESDSHDPLEARPRALDPGRYDRALREAEALNLDYGGPFESVHIVGFNNDLTSVTPLDEIRLSSS